MNEKTKELLARLTVPDTPPCHRQSILLEGDPGSGKTHTALHAPGPILVIYADNNRMTLDMMKARRPGEIIEVRVQDFEKDFDRGILLAVKNRELDVETVVVDTMDMLLALVVEAVGQYGTKKLGHDEWAQVLNTSRRVTNELTQACRPIPGKPDYNIIATIHMQDSTDSKGSLIKYEPSLQGSFRNKIEAYFDLVLLADSETVRVPVQGQTRPEQKKQCFIRTVPPTLYYKGLKAPTNWPARIAGGFQEIQRLIDKDIEDLKKPTKEV